MGYQPGYIEVVPPMVGTHTAEWSAISRTLSSGPGSANYESAARACYYALSVPVTTVVRRVWWANGSNTAGGATVEVGIYANVGGAYKPGVKLVSGSATQGTASQVQFVDVTDTVLAPGLYWIAVMASSGTNTTLQRTAIIQQEQRSVRFQEASANPLPATATPVAGAFTAVWLCGFATTASP